MKKLISLIKKNYIYVNITIFLLTIYVILFPIISKSIQSIFPNFNKCSYLIMTGKPCPLCGGTRYIEGLTNVFHDITYLFHPFGVIMIVIFIEFFYRLYNIFTYKKEKSNKYIEIDIIISLYLVIAFFLYEFLFFINQK